jgi:hypothetical protein
MGFSPQIISDSGPTVPQIRFDSSIWALESNSKFMLTLNPRILVAKYQFGCHMSNTKVSPRLATPDGPVFVSSALCREIFHTYGMKLCIDGCIECLTLNWALTW